jgi:hypothetical protein
MYAGSQLPLYKGGPGNFLYSPRRHELVASYLSPPRHELQARASLWNVLLNHLKYTRTKRLITVIQTVIIQTGRPSFCIYLC